MARRKGPITKVDPAAFDSAGANVYDPKNDLARVPLGVRQRTNSAERFTMTIEPSGGGGVIAMQWGATRLETPFSVVRK